MGKSDFIGGNLDEQPPRRFWLNDDGHKEATAWCKEQGITITAKDSIEYIEKVNEAYYSHWQVKQNGC